MGFDWRCVVQWIHMAVLCKMHREGKRVSYHMNIYFSLKTDVFHKKFQD